MKRGLQVSTKKGASSWLATLPIAEHDFALHKSTFREALRLRYGWKPPNLPSHCIVSKFMVEHSLICSHGGFPSIRPNELRDITTKFLTEVWN